MIRALLHKFFYGRKRWQTLFEKCYSAALSGMNHGWVDLLVDGEIYFLKRVRAELRRGKAVVFDVGANHGQYAEHALRVLGPEIELHCFEPSAVACGALSKNLSGNRNVRIHPYALGDSHGPQALYAAHLGGTGSSLHRNDLPGSPWVYDKTEKIEVRRLDDVCRELGISKIDLLKIDTEGHELQVLQGARKMIEAGGVRRIQFEFGEGSVSSGTHFLDFYRLLSPRYGLFRLLKDGLRSVEPYRLHAEVFLTTNYVALLRNCDGELDASGR